MITFYYTATGNSLALAKEIGGELIAIPQLADFDQLAYKADAIGIVFPIYSPSTPTEVLQFLSQAALDADYFFAIGTFGNDAGQVMMSVAKFAETRGIHFDYLTQLQTVDNYLPVFEMAEEAATLLPKKTRERTKQIKEDILARRRSKIDFRSATEIAVVNPAIDPAAAESFLVDERCNLCGICAKVCPAGNITVKEKVYFGAHCENCEACLHWCPENALHLKEEKSSARWQNPSVKLREIIRANWQDQKK
ncbi:EFR1 family ferrodoxin [Enterococcus hirae]|nr:EFR1 family ferrodoxin [Enterococcus hirae]